MPRLADPWRKTPLGFRHPQFGEVRREPSTDGRRLPEFVAITLDGKVLGRYHSLRRAKDNLMRNHHGIPFSA